ncbi:MAG: LysM peptidoglycan-binding domain-containing protein [Chloroflexi bacterium]|nr:LysM peptidoglycan-binding domain-containing protein [Chloroflexota bacterium]
MARLRPPPRLPQRRKFSLAHLPWGVIGVGAVIVILVLGAVLLLRNAGGTGLPATVPTSTTVAATQLPTVAPSWTPEAQATQTEIVAPTDTTEPPTSVPPPPTDTPVAPEEYEVQSGDTCGGIATKYGVSLDSFLALNNLDENNCLIRVGEKLLIPPPTPTAGPSPTLPAGVTPQPSGTPEPTATLPPQIIYQVNSGDTCSEIAAKYQMTVDELIAQNGLDVDCTLQIGQVLTLTFAIPTPAVSPTPNVAQTPTPRVGYEAPTLVSPRDGEAISETQEVVTLQWLSVGILPEDQWYVVQVQPSGAITVPVYETKATSIKLTRAIFGDQDERSFAWWVQVKQLLGVNSQTGERVYNTLSEPSTVRRFTWHRPIVTPTPVVTP